MLNIGRLTRDEFEYWLFQMDETLATLYSYVSPDVAVHLDYSIASLTVLETWILNRYTSREQTRTDSESTIIEALSCYIGETLRKVAGGIWDIELDNPKDAYYCLPVIHRKGSYKECPVTLVTACVDRRRGDYLTSVVQYLSNRYGL